MSALPAVRRSLTSRVDAFSRPARTFTGDFYFAHRTADGVWFALGDVAGKGLPAAIVMAMIQEELEQRIVSCSITACDPARTMQRLHDFLLPLMPANRFATSVIGHLDDDGTLLLANAGHCPPLVVRGDGSIEEIASTGPILGILRDPSWRSYRGMLDEGEALVLYSDGVTESAGIDDDLGVCGLRRIVRTVGVAPNAIANALGATNDDVTIMTVSRG